MHKFKLYVVLNLIKFTLFTALTLYSISSSAYQLDWTDQVYTHFSKEEPLREMLKSIASDQNINIIISDKVTDNVSTYFREKKPQDILSELKISFGLTSYFDGNALYIYKKNEMQNATVLLSKSPILALEYDLISMGALDPKDENIKWVINRSENSATVNGPKRFIDIVFRIAKKIEESVNVSVYKWTTEGGSTNYSNEPPFGISYKKVMVMRSLAPKGNTKDHNSSLKPATDVKMETVQ